MNQNGPSNRHILIIDDNQDIHQDFRKIFDAGGGSLGKFPLQHDAIDFRGLRTLHLVAIAARSDQRQRHYAARLNGGNQLGGGGLEKETVYGSAGEEFE